MLQKKNPRRAFFFRAGGTSRKSRIVQQNSCDPSPAAMPYYYPGAYSAYSGYGGAYSYPYSYGAASYAYASPNSYASYGAYPYSYGARSAYGYGHGGAYGYY